MIFKQNLSDSHTTFFNVTILYEVIGIDRSLETYGKMHSIQFKYLMTTMKLTPQSICGLSQQT